MPREEHHLAGTERPATIEVRVGELMQLFNSLDASPFHERDLDDDAEAYIAGWAKELPPLAPLQIVVHLPQPEAIKAEERGLEAAFANYFNYREGVLERDYRERVRMGRRALAVGMIVLALCTTAAQFMRTFLLSDAVGQFVAEGLIIFGWVANWRPAEIFLYEIWEMRRTCRLYRRLAAAKVVVSVQS